MVKHKNYKYVIVLDSTTDPDDPTGQRKISYVESLSQSGYLKSKAEEYGVDISTISIITLEEFNNTIATTNDTLFLAFGRDFYDNLRELNTQKVIHIGLRNFNYQLFCTLPFVHVGTNRIVFDAFGRTKALDMYFSDESKRQYLELPKTKCVGLKEGTQILNWLTDNIKHEFEDPCGYDWYNNPKHYKWENEIGFDFETRNNFVLNQAFPELYGTEVTGFALSWDQPNNEGGKAFFFDFRSDYNYDEEYRKANKEKFDSEYEDFLCAMDRFFTIHQKHIWAYNASFEYLMLYKLLRKFYYIQDSYALCIAHDERKNLKYNVQKLLRCPSWDDKLDEEMDDVGILASNFKNYEEFKAFYDGYHNNTLDDETKNAVDPEVFNICEWYKENSHRLPLLRDNWGGGWGACIGEHDNNELGIYCCYDAFYGLELGRLLIPAYGSNCYWEILQHRYIGSEMKLHGMKIDKKKTLHLMKYCSLIKTNFELMANQLYLKAYFKTCNPLYNKIQVNDCLKKILTEAPYILDIDNIKFGKNIIGYIYSKAEELGKSDDYIPIEELNNLAGCDLSDEFEWMSEDNWTLGESRKVLKSGIKPGGKLCAKRKLMSEIGDLFFNITDIPSILKEINKEATPVLFKFVEDKYQQAKQVWILKSIDIWDSEKLFEILDWWKANYSTKSIENEEYKLADVIKYNYPNFDESETEIALDTPDSVRNMVTGLYNITEEKYQNCDLLSFIRDDIKEEIVKSEAKFPTLSGFIEYYSMIKVQEELDNIDLDHDILTESKYKDTGKPVRIEDYKERLMNYYSADQQYDFHYGLLGKAYERTIRTLRRTTTVFEDFEGDGGWNEDAFTEDVANFFKYFISNTSLKSQVLLTGSYNWNKDLYKPENRFDEAWGTTFVQYAGINGAIYLHILTSQPAKDIKCDINYIPEHLLKLPKNDYEMEQLQTLWYLVVYCTMRLLSGVAQKTQSTYCTALDTMTIKVPYNKDRHINATYEDVINGVKFDKKDGWLQAGMQVQEMEEYCIADHIYDPHGDEWCDSIPDVWYFPDLHLNTVETKRNSSDYHTWKHGSEYQKCLVDEDDRFHIYFDISQLPSCWI